MVVASAYEETSDEKLALELRKRLVGAVDLCRELSDRGWTLRVSMEPMTYSAGRQTSWNCQVDISRTKNETL